MYSGASPFLISIHPQYVRAILAGRKTVECRKSAIGLAPGDLLYLYATAPEKAILGTARVTELYKGPPAVLWAKHQARTCVRKEDFDAYYQQSESAVLIGLCDVRVAAVPVPLSALRALQAKFSPPQTARRLGPVFASLGDMLASGMETV
jgi:predicted transcriptional regulator